jgi:hypothetical protein
MFLALIGALLVPPTVMVLVIATFEREPGPVLLACAMGGVSLVTLGRLFQRTVVEVRGGELAWWTRPFTLSREVYLKAAQIDQLASVQEWHQAGRDAVTQYQMYGVSVFLKDGTRLKLARHLPEAGDALFLEQQIERALGLADRPVGGELPR